MVNFALDGERDTCLQGEVQQFHRAHERVADLTEDLAKLKKLGVNNLLHTMPWVWTHAAIEVSWYQGEQLKLLGEIVCNDLMFGLIRLDMALADNYGSGAGSLD